MPPNSTVSLVPALDKLEARGWLARRASQEDRRVNGMWLTPDGAALLKKLKQRVGATNCGWRAT